MTQHTPGPWKNDAGAGVVSLSQTEILKSGRRVAKRVAIAKGETVEEVIDNARLIAAAPELLAALKALKAAVNCNYTRATMAHEGILTRVDAALAAAE